MGIERHIYTSRDEWLLMRRRDITASVAGALLGQHPYVTPYALWAEKTGKIKEDPEENVAMKRGRLLEPVAIQLLQEERPCWKIQYPLRFYLRDGLVRLGATPDAYADRPDCLGFGIVQVKSVSDYAFRKWRDEGSGDLVLPLYIAVQAIVEAYLSGASWACVAALVIGHGCELHVIDVPLHAGILERVKKEVSDFWSMSDSGAMPAVDWKQDGKLVLDLLKQDDGSETIIPETMLEVITEYHESKKLERLASSRAEELKPQIISALGNAQVGVLPGWFVTAKTVRRKGHYVEDSTFRKLTVKREVA